MKEIRHSCVDCGTTNCSSMNSTFPPFCVSQTIPEEVMDSVMTEYQDPVNRQIMIVASEVEDTGYCEWPRVQEIVEFANSLLTIKYTNITIPKIIVPATLNNKCITAALLAFF